MTEPDQRGPGLPWDPDHEPLIIPRADAVPPPAPSRSPAPPPRPGAGLLGPLLGGLIGSAVTILALVASGLVQTSPAAPPPVTAARVVAATAAPTAATGVAEVAASVLPSIVTVQVEGFGGPGSGSGVVYSDSGYVITNDHVVKGGESFTVEFSDGTSVPARLVGSDPLTDLAVLDVDRAGVTPIVFGDASTLQVGDVAVAVGNPLGLRGGPSVTAGVVSALGRTLQVSPDTVLYGLLQTDAPITRGSSGGALVNDRGELIGITTAIGVSDVGAEGLGFAVPSDLVAGVVPDLIVDGEVRHAFLGITGTTATARAAGGFAPSGAVITDFVADSALRAAGAQVGDVIVAIDGEPVSSLDELITRLRHRRAGDSATITVERNGNRIDLDVTLGWFRP